MTSTLGGIPQIKLPDLAHLGFTTMPGAEGAQEIDVSELGYVDDLLGIYSFRELAEIGD